MKERAQHPLPLSAQMSKWEPRECCLGAHSEAGAVPAAPGPRAGSRAHSRETEAAQRLW